MKEGAFATYFVQPIMEKIYGYNAVCFVNIESMPKKGTELKSRMKKEEFLKGLKLKWKYLPSNANRIVELCPIGDMLVGEQFYENDSYRLFEHIRKLSEYYDVEFNYADDYLRYFNIYYNTDIQRELGLR